MESRRLNSACHLKGFSLLELLIVIIIISTLLGFAIEKLLKLQVQAERSSMEGMIGTMQSAIALTISEHIAKDKIPELRKYLNSNPMALLADTPINYLGQFEDSPENPEPASWWYEQNSHTLVYFALNQDHFVTQSGHKGQTKFKIVAVYDDNNHNERFDRGDALKGLRLSPLTKYHWSKESIEPN